MQTKDSAVNNGFSDQWPRVDFHDFHLRELPARLASGYGQIAAEASRELLAICFRLKDTDNAYTYRPGPNSIEIIAGTEADTVVELDQDSWQSLVYDLKSAPSLLYSGKLAPGCGDPMVFERWESVLRAMYYGRLVYDLGKILVDSGGRWPSAL